MRKPSFQDCDSLEVKMTPMIDVVFLLLIFFVWTSSFELPEFDLPSAIAEPPAGGTEVSVEETPPVEPFDEIVVRVYPNEASFILELNGKPLDSVAMMKNRLAQIIALGTQPPIIIDPSDEITMNTAVEVYDAARAAGADRVLFAVRPQ
ncbi:MAG: biopolymer transporter ExbD [Pirellulales bacterium]|nr:biopolymer transporter ExbD [Pirellulales bacterium]